MVPSLVKRVAPEPIVSLGRRLRGAYRACRWQRVVPLSETAFRDVLEARLDVGRGDIVFVHSSLDGLRLAFPWFRLMALLREAVGPQGTLVFPTYPSGVACEFLRRGEVFDVRSTRSFSGALSELARRDRGAVRSLHPTKSVCAIGPAAEALCAAHHQSPFPYDATSPYFRLAEMNGKAVGLGVSTARMSFVHAVDDYLKESFPVRVYLPGVFRATCVDASGRTSRVATYAHDLDKMRHDVPRFCRKYLPRTTCEDLSIGGVRFFRADARATFGAMIELARRGISIYPRSVYQKRRSRPCASD